MAESERSLDKNKSQMDPHIEVAKKGERSSHETPTSENRKGKQPQTQSKKMAGKTKESHSVRSVIDNSENKLLSAIQSLHGALNKQTSQMAEHEKQINDQNKQMREFASRLSYFEEYTGEEDLDYDEEYQNDDCENEQEQIDKSDCADDPEVGSRKRKAMADENNNSRFKSMAKRFKSVEPCDTDIDSLLAENVTELFRNGIDEDRYSELVKDENNGRPANCDGLVVTQTNQMIWEAMSPVARSSDKKMQNIETSVVKSATILTKVVEKMAKMEGELKNDNFSKLIDDCNDALALMGHANKQINLTRKDFLRPELKREYSHLCNHNRPYTKYLFGDDVSKSAREIEDCSKISNRMFQNRPGPFRGTLHRRPNRFPRFRGGYGRGFRGRGSLYDIPSTSTGGSTSKNFPRRGSRPYRQ